MASCRPISLFLNGRAAETISQLDADVLITGHCGLVDDPAAYVDRRLDNMQQVAGAVGAALGGVTSYDYDERGNRVAQTDAEGRTTLMEYDALGRRVAEIYQALVNRDPGAARAAMHQHFALILNKLIATSEAEQVEEARRKAEEVRKRFSLEHLVKQA